MFHSIINRKHFISLDQCLFFYGVLLFFKSILRNTNVILYDLISSYVYINCIQQLTRITQSVRGKLRYKIKNYLAFINDFAKEI